MSYEAKILKDSVSPLGHRLTSFEITFPRPVLAEFNTHRVFSRNSASSRAIPVKKQLRRVLEDPFVPGRFGINEKGMQSFSFLEGVSHEDAEAGWLRGRDRAVVTALELLLGYRLVTATLGREPTAERLANDLDGLIAHLEEAVKRPGWLESGILNVHKQITNRGLEPYMWHTVLVTSTEWSNFYALRVDKEAQPEIRQIADMMLQLHEASQPTPLAYGQWALPLVSDEELAEYGADAVEWRQISTGRSARISNLTHDGIRDPAEDVKLHNKLQRDGHMSPFEHPARPMTPEEFAESEWSGNFHGWHQYRKDIPDESDFALVKARLKVVES